MVRPIGTHSTHILLFWSTIHTITVAHHCNICYIYFLYYHIHCTVNAFAAHLMICMDQPDDLLQIHIHIQYNHMPITSTRIFFFFAAATLNLFDIYKLTYRWRKEKKNNVDISLFIAVFNFIGLKLYLKKKNRLRIQETETALTVSIIYSFFFGEVLVFILFRNILNGFQKWKKIVNNFKSWSQNQFSNSLFSNEINRKWIE